MVSLTAPPDRTSQETRDGKEDTIHDTKSKAGLQHGAGLLDLHAHAMDIGAAKRPEIDIVPRAIVHGCAVGVRDEAQCVDAGDERPHETEIDEGDEERVVARAVVREEGGDRPGASEHGHDEEDQDVVWGEGVVGGVDVDEKCEHS
ncbi:hypothetical protein NHQ30_009229 [Ciborinia camelliae]|nr:hypothetical protein NHQ30_009229 [Ciborinia camelliae]